MRQRATRYSLTWTYLKNSAYGISLSPLGCLLLRPATLNLVRTTGLLCHAASLHELRRPPVHIAVRSLDDYFSLPPERPLEHGEMSESSPHLSYE